MTEKATIAPVPRASTGIPGLDDILGGGLPKDRLYLVKGTPGVGKTTMALQFLIEGARRGERVLYLTLSESEDEIRQVASSHGWSLDGVSLHELSSAEQTLRLKEENTLYATKYIGSTVMLRPELRFDHSWDNRGYDNGTARNQFFFGMDLIYKF